MNGLSNPVILVIDADPLTLTATAATLHTRQYEIHCAQDREAAIKAVSQYNFDLILSDVDLRGRDGVALVEEIRTIPDCADIPAMFISSVQLPDVISRSNRSGSSFYLRKPFDPRLLLELVEKALWMPHLIRSHINRPHIPIGNLANSHTTLSSPSSYV